MGKMMMANRRRNREERGKGREREGRGGGSGTKSGKVDRIGKEWRKKRIRDWM